MRSMFKPGMLVAALSALAFAFAAATASAQAETPRVKCEKEAQAEGLTEAADIKAYVYECLAVAEAEAAPPKPVAAKDAAKPAGASQ